MGGNCKTYSRWTLQPCILWSLLKVHLLRAVCAWAPSRESLLNIGAGSAPDPRVSLWEDAGADVFKTLPGDSEAQPETQARGPHAWGGRSLSTPSILLDLAHLGGELGSSALEADLKHHPDQQRAPPPPLPGAVCPWNGIFVLLPCRWCVGPACCVRGGAGLCPMGPSTLCAYPGHSPLTQGESILTVFCFCFCFYKKCLHTPF